MKEIIREKRVEYMTFLNKQLHHNKDRVSLEKETYNKLMNSFSSVSPLLTKELEHELKNIAKKEEESKKIVENLENNE